MELKDVVLSALAELENAQQEKEQVISKNSDVQREQQGSSLQPLNQVLEQSEKVLPVDEGNAVEKEPMQPSVVEENIPTPPESVIVHQEPIVKYVTDPKELRFLQNLRERILVLFEGFQSPNNVKIEAKVDLILNFLEYTLASIDERSEEIKENS